MGYGGVAAPLPRLAERRQLNAGPTFLELAAGPMAAPCRSTGRLCGRRPIRLGACCWPSSLPFEKVTCSWAPSGPRSVSRWSLTGTALPF